MKTINISIHKIINISDKIINISADIFFHYAFRTRNQHFGTKKTFEIYSDVKHTKKLEN